MDLDLREGLRVKNELTLLNHHWIQSPAADIVFDPGAALSGQGEIRAEGVAHTYSHLKLVGTDYTIGPGITLRNDATEFNLEPRTHRGR